MNVRELIQYLRFENHDLEVVIQHQDTLVTSAIAHGTVAIGKELWLYEANSLLSFNSDPNTDGAGV